MGCRFTLAQSQVFHGVHFAPWLFALSWGAGDVWLSSHKCFGFAQLFWLPVRTNIWDYSLTLAAVFAQFLWGAEILWLPVRISIVGCRCCMAVSQSLNGLQVSFGCGSQASVGLQLLRSSVALFHWVAASFWLPVRSYIVGYSWFLAAVAQILWVAEILWLIAQILWVAEILWLIARLLGVASFSWLPFAISSWVAVKSWLPVRISTGGCSYYVARSHRHLGLQSYFGCRVRIVSLGCIYILAVRTVIGGYRRYQAFAHRSFGVQVFLAVSQSLNGLQLSFGCGSHASVGLHLLRGSVALFHWVAASFWLPVRTHLMGCRFIVARSQPLLGLQSYFG